MEPDKLTDLEDKAWMREALKLADLAAAEGEVPVGAVIEKDGRRADFSWKKSQRARKKCSVSRRAGSD